MSMETVAIQGTDLVVSRIALGTWAMGGWLWGGTDEKDSIRTVHEALDKGITLIDTAPVYGFGVSESLIGKALKESSLRDRAILATKVGLAWKDGKTFRDASFAQIQHDIDESLRRLGRDWVDILQVHWPDSTTPGQETAEALDKLRVQGKVRALGVSNYGVEQMEEFARFAPLHTSQPPYNLFERQIEKDILPHCQKQGITTLMYGALCRGLLSGRMAATTRFEGDDIRKVDPKFQPDRRPGYLAAVEELSNFAKEMGKTVLQLAVRWVLDRPGASVAIWGARRPAQLDPIDGIHDFRLLPEHMARIDEVVEKHIPDPVGPEFMAPPVRKRKS
jgi:aryl-alcohol dehydrogenase-like predicted oxidoreductase